MLRIHPPEVYDDWVTGDLRFNSPEFKEALGYMSDIWFNEDYVARRARRDRAHAVR